MISIATASALWLDHRNTNAERIATLEQERIHLLASKEQQISDAQKKLEDEKAIRLKLEQDKKRLELEKKISGMLSDAEKRMADKRLTKPPGDNALQLLQEVKRLQPANARADALLEQMLSRYIDWAQTASSENAFDTAREYLDAAGLVRADSEKLKDALVELDDAIKQHERFEVERRRKAELTRIEAKKKQQSNQTVLGKNPFSVIPSELSGGGFGPELVVLPAGEFQMGSPESESDRSKDESPLHRVRLPSFAIGKYEVTFAQYDRFAESTQRDKPSDQGWGREDQLPVININWNDANDYGQWLTAQRSDGLVCGLPSEAEWEYAARADTTTPFWTGKTISTDQANYDGNYSYGNGKKGEYRERITPVDRFDANPWGLHDMHGNVWEWAQDCWHDSYSGAPDDGNAWLEANGGDCSRRVLRGGSWFSLPGLLRSAFRGGFDPGYRSGYLGFRVVCRPQSSSTGH